MAKVAPNRAVEADLLRARIVDVDEKLEAVGTQLADGRQGLMVAAAGLAPSSTEVRGLDGEELRLLGLRMEQTRLGDERARVEAVVSTPVILHALAIVFQPSSRVNATAVALFWVVVLLFVEGLLRGRLQSVIVRLVAAAVVIGLYYALVDWRIVLAAIFYTAAALLLVVNVRDAWRR